LGVSTDPRTKLLVHGYCCCCMVQDLPEHPVGFHVHTIMLTQHLSHKHAHFTAVATAVLR
jgi:hypothetical protein